MYRLFETIKVFEKRLWNIEFHNFRFNNSRKELFGIRNQLDLAEIIKLPESLGNDLYKCRVLYDREIISIDYEKYYRKNIQSLMLVCSDNANYQYKFSDRKMFDELLKNKKHCDEILIVKNRFITDTSFSNVAFFDGSDWYTPENPLLLGTKRAELLKNNQLKLADIRVDDICKFKKISLINAMNDLQEIELPVTNIVI